MKHSQKELASSFFRLRLWTQDDLLDQIFVHYENLDDEINSQIGKLKSIVEKPEPAKAPSTKAVVGRYILTPEIFNLLENIGAGAGNEIQLTDAIAELLIKEQVYSLVFEGKRYDCGSKIGYLQATVEYALKHPELKDEFSSYLLSKGYL